MSKSDDLIKIILIALACPLLLPLAIQAGDGEE